MVAAIFVKAENGVQSLIYYISHDLRDIETRYPQVEKLVYFLVVTDRKLYHYFQDREIQFINNQPLKRILHKPYMNDRLATWMIKLSQF